MDRVIGVSWPRSGHHLLVRLLRAYFGDRFTYCDFYGGIEGCCKTLPCTRADVTFTKSHDFDLALPQIPDRKYIIQYREFLPSVVSNYELYLLQPGTGPDTAETFLRFASKAFAEYRNFREKWVDTEFSEVNQVFEYEQLIAWPKESLALAAQWFAPDEEPDMARIEEAVAEVDGEKVERWKVEKLGKVGVHQGRDISEFRHYRPDVFKQLSRMKLTREEVTAAFRSVLRRDPAEANMIRFQTIETVEELEETLRGTEEYRNLAALDDDEAPENPETQRRSGAGRWPVRTSGRWRPRSR